MTKAFGNEWASKGVQVSLHTRLCRFCTDTRILMGRQVNCICPGYIKAPLAETLTRKYPEMEEYITNRTPAGRWGIPANLRGTALFLSSPAPDFVTGTSIVVDGRMMASGDDGGRLERLKSAFLCGPASLFHSCIRDLSDSRLERSSLREHKGYAESNQESPRTDCDGWFGSTPLLQQQSGMDNTRLYRFRDAAAPWHGNSASQDYELVV